MLKTTSTTSSEISLTSHSTSFQHHLIPVVNRHTPSAVYNLVDLCHRHELWVSEDNQSRLALHHEVRMLVVSTLVPLAMAVIACHAHKSPELSFTCTLYYHLLPVLQISYPSQALATLKTQCSRLLFVVSRSLASSFMTSLSLRYLTLSDPLSDLTMLHRSLPPMGTRKNRRGYRSLPAWIQQPMLSWPQTYRLQPRKARKSPSIGTARVSLGWSPICKSPTRTSTASTSRPDGTTSAGTNCSSRRGFMIGSKGTRATKARVSPHASCDKSVGRNWTARASRYLLVLHPR